MKEYFVTVESYGNTYHSVETEKSLAELWEQDQEAGFLDSIVAYDADTLARVNVYEIASAYLAEQKAIQDEYEEYTEYVNEYGYDYQDNLEMGFNPYEGAYDYDC